MKLFALSPYVLSTVMATSPGAILNSVPNLPLSLPLFPPAAGTVAQVKSVFAHFMVGNTYHYGVEDWKKDIVLAMGHEIDAFALNVGREDWQRERVQDAFTAAAGTDFRLFISLDMTSIPCASPADAEPLKQYIKEYYHHPNQFRYNGLPMISTFFGEGCLFGTGSPNQGWMSAIKGIGDMPLTFIPSFFVDPGKFGEFTVMDGAFSWNSGWPMDNIPADFEMDEQYIRGLGGRTYMAAMSPWFFTHYGPDTWNKNWIFRTEDWHLCRRWELLIQNRAKIGIAEIVTWNDYGESHYIGPIAGDQPMSQAWVDGFDHQGWLPLIQYYIHAFKTGEYPTIVKDQVFMWGRLYPAGADASDHVAKPKNWGWTEDNIYVVVLLTGRADVTLKCGPTKQEVTLGPGLSKLKIRPIETCQATVAISRLGVIVVDHSPPGYRFTTGPPSYNFNAFVSSS